MEILEVLKNAEYNLQNSGPIGLKIAKDQLHNAIVLLEKDYDLYDDFNEIISDYITVEDVPEKVATPTGGEG